MGETVASLRWHWDTAYTFAKTGRRYTAERLDGQGTLTAVSPDELLTLVRVDYAARPVPRYLPYEADRDDA